jgi:hypothetical protein
MNISTAYKTRPIRFLEIYTLQDWKIKMYSISVRHTLVDAQNIENAKQLLHVWLQDSEIYPLETYKIATLILHEGKEGCFAIINWWISENMLQQFVYLAKNEQPAEFKLYSNNGIFTCVWEMEVLWFEKNAWVKNILMKADKPDVEAYLDEHLNVDI